MKDGYTAASSFPWKLIRNTKDIVDGTKLTPYHIQVIPTNRCNGNCPWCSCRDVDRDLELDIGELRDILYYFYNLGTKSMTITGGGEPTMHPDLKEFVNYAHILDIDCGMVTNGLKIAASKDIHEYDYLNKLTWMRISVIDTIGHYNTDIIKKTCKKLRNVDVGISFTVTKDVNIETAKEVCKVAEEIDNLTHIRFVQDLVELPRDIMVSVFDACHWSSKAIFQDRSEYSKGSCDCLLSKVKPVIDASGHIFPCCGVQYAGDTVNCMPEEFKMCHWSDFEDIKHFSGEVCKRCYYKEYNHVLQNLIRDWAHLDFI